MKPKNHLVGIAFAVIVAVLVPLLSAQSSPDDETFIGEIYYVIDLEAGFKEYYVKPIKFNGHNYFISPDIRPLHDIATLEKNRAPWAVGEEVIFTYQPKAYDWISATMIPRNGGDRKAIGRGQRYQRSKE
jgi:hypothetical protein